MPHLESALGRVSGSQYFSTFDLSNGYWQLDLHEDSRDCKSFLTPDGVFTPTRVLHGASNAVAYMQSSLQGILGSMSSSILSWLDDLFLHAPSVEDLLANLRQFFTICRFHNLKLHPHKCSLFSVEGKWCGRIISAAGVRFDPRRL
jgi:Reverse transcriptase (RNA-dependent DNA polymerase)